MNTLDRANRLIEKVEEGHSLSREELIALLEVEDMATKARLFAAARRTRQRQFGDKVFLYAFIYFSTWCRNNCNFCFFRKNNEVTIRYRKTPEEVLALARLSAASGVHLLDLTMGEDPAYHSDEFATLLDLVKAIKEELDMPVMISPGVIGDELLEAFGKLGVEWYAVYQETYNREIFRKLRIGQDFDVRLRAKNNAAKHGILVEEGLLTGIGESVTDIAEALLAMGATGAKQMRVMTFVPQKGTPMEHLPAAGHDMELKIIALLRLLYPDVLIPASLDVEGLEGLDSRINAGSNVVTSIIPPRTGLAGVAQSTLDVDEGGRTVAEVLPRLEKLGCRPAALTEYREWLQSAR